MNMNIAKPAPVKSIPAAQDELRELHRYDALDALLFKLFVGMALCWALYSGASLLSNTIDWFPILMLAVTALPALSFGVTILHKKNKSKKLTAFITGTPAAS